MTIYQSIKDIDQRATIELINRDVIIVSPMIIEISSYLKSIKEDCWIMSSNSIMINRR